MLLKARNRDLSASYNSLGHVNSPGKSVDMAKALPVEPRREAYQSLPRFMANNSNRNGVALVSEKSLAETGAEGWRFYDAKSSFKVQTNSEISKATAQLKLIMQEKNQLAIARKLDAIDPLQPKKKQKRQPLWQKSTC